MAKEKNNQRKKERGTGLSIWLILIMLQSILAVFLILDYTKWADEVSLPFILSGLFLAATARFVGAIAIWRWEKWGLYLYAGGVIAALAFSLVLTGNMLWVFSDILPLAITGWLLKDKYDNFE